jgi:hypothetical protein
VKRIKRFGNKRQAVALNSTSNPKPSISLKSGKKCISTLALQTKRNLPMTKLRQTLAILLLSFSLSCSPVFAQEAESTEAAPTEVPLAVVVVESPAEKVASSDSSPALPESFSTIAFAAPLVTLLVAILKRYLPKTIPAAQLNFYLSLLVFVAYTIASQNGLDAQFKAFTGDFYSIVNALSNLITGFGGTAILSAGIYTAANHYQIPYLGKARLPQAEAQSMERPRD